MNNPTLTLMMPIFHSRFNMKKIVAKVVSDAGGEAVFCYATVRKVRSLCVCAGQVLLERKGAATIKASYTINWLLRSVTKAMFGIVVAVAVFLETVSATSVCIIDFKSFLYSLIYRIRHTFALCHLQYYSEN